MTEEAVHGVREELCDLVHEQLAGVDGRPHDPNGAAGVVDHDERVVGDEAAQRPDFRREEVCREDGSRMFLEEGLPRRGDCPGLR